MGEGRSDDPKGGLSVGQRFPPGAKSRRRFEVNCLGCLGYWDRLGGLGQGNRGCDGG